MRRRGLTPDYLHGLYFPAHEISESASFALPFRRHERARKRDSEEQAGAAASFVAALATLEELQKVQRERDQYEMLYTHVSSRIS